MEDLIESPEYLTDEVVNPEQKEYSDPRNPRLRGHGSCLGLGRFRDLMIFSLTGYDP